HGEDVPARRLPPRGDDRAPARRRRHRERARRQGEPAAAAARGRRGAVGARARGRRELGRLRPRLLQGRDEVRRPARGRVRREVRLRRGGVPAAGPGQRGPQARAVLPADRPAHLVEPRAAVRAARQGHDRARLRRGLLPRRPVLDVDRARARLVLRAGVHPVRGLRAGRAGHRHMGARAPRARPRHRRRPTAGAVRAPSPGPMSEPVEGPLAGIRVLDAATILAGPLAAQILGDYGADVIKVEHPTRGDGMRGHGLDKDGEPLWWKMVGRNKRTVGLYLGDPDGAEVFRKLARTADVVIENFRPGTFERWGLGYDVLSADNPGLILLRVTGFGQHGPYATRPAFGTLVESMSGFA